jgi:hypothetical protein
MESRQAKKIVAAAGAIAVYPATATHTTGQCPVIDGGRAV